MGPQRRLARSCPPPARLIPASRRSSRPQRRQLRRPARPDRPGAPRHPPPGCLRAATAARRAPWDRYAAGGLPCVLVQGQFPRGCVLPIGVSPIRCSAIGDLETDVEDARFAENEDGNMHISPRRSLSGTHFARNGRDARLEMGGSRCAPGLRPEAGGLSGLLCAAGAEEPSRE